MQYRHRRAHRRIWTVLAILLPLVVVAGILLRQPVTPDAPVRLSPPSTSP